MSDENTIPEPEVDETLALLRWQTLCEGMLPVLGGDTLRLSLATADFNDYGCDLVWLAVETSSGREVARGKQGIVFFDYSARCKARVPDVFRARTAGA